MKRGFTAIEMLVVIAIISILFSMTTISYVSWQRNISLINASEELKSMITRAQQLAVSAASNDSWGVHVDLEYYALFKGSFYNEAEPSNQIKQLNGVKIDKPWRSFSDGVASTTADVVFSKYIGTTVNTGTITLYASADASSTRQLIIQPTGIVD